jgi:hypothetical protein
MRERLIPSAKFGILFGLLSWPAYAALEPGVYQTIPGITIIESGDRVPNGIRTVPFSATLAFDLNIGQPVLTAVIPNAVLEGGEPFALTVRSSTGLRLMDGTYRFTGDYLRDLSPSGTQYGFDWRFSASTNQGVVWNGIIGWAGGHAWTVTISNITLVPRPRLDIIRADSKVIVSWPATSTNYILEQAESLLASRWSTVPNGITIRDDRFSIAIEASTAQAFFRLRKLDM